MVKFGVIEAQGSQQRKPLGPIDPSERAQWHHFWQSPHVRPPWIQDPETHMLVFPAPGIHEVLPPGQGSHHTLSATLERGMQVS